MNSQRTAFGTRASDESELATSVREMVNRRPTVGLAVGVVHNGSLEFFHGHGVADVRSKRPVDMDTVFRVASITKTFTAIAIMQLQGPMSVHLDVMPLSALEAA
jgi:CubicO group peptidase (beta-lactamase class C family)